MAMRFRNRKHGFTLVELLVVISIIALLISILLPSLKRARDQAKDTLCRANLKQLGVANNYYASDNQDRMMWIMGTDRNGIRNATPFRQFHQIVRLWPYIKDLKIYQCPKAKSGRVQVVRSVAFVPNGNGPISSVTGYNQGKDSGEIGYYNAFREDAYFLEMWQNREFPELKMEYLAGLGGTEPIPEVYTEYWYADWAEGASNHDGTIPAISGNMVNRIPYPEYAVVMADAIDWAPRHNGGNLFLFLDTHVDWIRAEKYYDPDMGGESDKDGFGNYPFYAWGLGRNVHGY